MKSAAPGYEVVRAYPHDPTAYTQGLIYRGGFLYESTGLHGRSTLRKVNLETGAVLQRVPVDAAYFAEGLATWRDRLIQLTWQSGLAFVYDINTLQRTGVFQYLGEGWGLTDNGVNLILSDGTSTLRFLDPATFKEVRRIGVVDQGRPVTNLNELEFVRGEVLANVWHSDRIARIAPDTGKVLGWIDLSGLLPHAYKLDSEAVLNGIAYDAEHDRLFVTGKLWPKLFELRLLPRP